MKCKCGVVFDGDSLLFCPDCRRSSREAQEFKSDSSRSRQAQSTSIRACSCGREFDHERLSVCPVCNKPSGKSQVSPRLTTLQNNHNNHLNLRLALLNKRLLWSVGIAAPVIIVLAWFLASSSANNPSVGLNKDYELVYSVPESWNKYQSKIFEELASDSVEFDGQVSATKGHCKWFNEDGRDPSRWTKLDFLYEGRSNLNVTRQDILTVIEGFASICPDPNESLERLEGGTTIQRLPSD